jgi:hypothetical protein
MSDKQETNPQANVKGDLQYPVIKLDPSNVPSELHHLIPYAEKWGIEDTKLRDKLLHEAPIEEIEELCAMDAGISDDVWRFILSEAPLDVPKRHEMRVFEALKETIGPAFEILMPQVTLKIIGWPEKWPGAKLDPAKLPAQLHPLIPYVEKWVIEDQGVRDTVFSIATKTELEGLVTAVNQIDGETVGRLALEMTEDKKREAEGYILLTLLELVEDAEFLLRTRPDFKL